MKSTGIVRKVDELGRVVIPMELRRTMNIDLKDPLEIFVDEKYLYFKKYAPGCVLCGSMDKLIVHKGKYVCNQCIEALPTLSNTKSE